MTYHLERDASPLVYDHLVKDKACHLQSFYDHLVREAYSLASDHLVRRAYPLASDRHVPGAYPLVFHPLTCHRDLGASPLVYRLALKA